MTKGREPDASLSSAVRLNQLFVGNDRAHGAFYPNKAAKTGRGKLSGGQSTVLGGPTEGLWQEHLDGKTGLGVHMLLPDANLWFAALDVDVYPLDPKPIIERVEKEKLPLVFCKSKSGGAHLYIFGREPLPAELVRRRLAEWAGTLGLPKFELYPTKDRLEGKTDHGKYLNMPYYEGENTQRFALNDRNEQLTVDQFLRHVEKRKVTVGELEGFKAKAGGVLDNAPPCLQSLLADGQVTEYRDNSLISIGVYLRLRYPDEWETQIEEYHRRYMPSPLSATEVVRIIKSVKKKDYNYLCKQEPLVSRCNSTVCITRKFGVRAMMEENGIDTGFSLNLGQLTKFLTDPPTWELEVNGQVLRMTTDQLITYSQFKKVVMERINVLPTPLKADSWAKIIQDKLSLVEEVEAPKDAGTAGQLRWHLEQHCLGLKARARVELKDGKPWWDYENGKIYFRSPILNEFLQKHKVFVEPRALVSQFRAWGFEHGQFNLQGVCVAWWSMPIFDEQTEADDVPKIAEQSAGF